MSIKEKDSAAEQPSEVDWRQYHSALCKCAELLPNMREGDSIFDTPRFLAEKIDRLAHLARQSPAPEKENRAAVDLHSAIMNLPCERTMSHFATRQDMILYKEGHRDARHAAAELALAAPVAQEVEPGSAPAAADEVRDAVLEEAARLCESREHITMLGEAAAKGCAREIRGLKTTASAATEQGGAA